MSYDIYRSMLMNPLCFFKLYMCLQFVPFVLHSPASIGSEHPLTVSSNVWGGRKIEDVICSGAEDNEETRPISSNKPALQFKVKSTVNSIQLW